MRAEEPKSGVRADLSRRRDALMASCDGFVTARSDDSSATDSDRLSAPMVVQEVTNVQPCAYPARWVEGSRKGRSCCCSSRPRERGVADARPRGAGTGG